ncbi:MAG: hypothetical protein AVDCRST_MAG53-1486, partial [uncultured Solirubrobacteraceae bacterium]
GTIRALGGRPRTQRHSARRWRRGRLGRQAVRSPRESL